MGKVMVVGDDKNNIIMQSPKNPEYGAIRVSQFTVQINDRGWLKTVKRYAFIKGLMVDLLNLDFKINQELDGKIIVVESLTPFYLENPDKHLKRAGKTGIICTLNDQPIYRETYYTENMELRDHFIMHDNGDEIRDVLEAQKLISSFDVQQKEEPVL